MLELLKNLIQDEEAQGIVEYGLVLGVLALTVVSVILAFRYDFDDLVIETNDRVEKIMNAIK